MAEKTVINISLHINQQVLDLRVPNQVSPARLKELLTEALALVNIATPENFILEVLNKPIKIKEDVVLDYYPLGDGDQLLVKEVINGGVSSHE